MNKKILIMVVGLIFIGAILFFLQKQSRTSNQTSSGAEKEKLTVVATFYPLEHFARQVGGAEIEVRTLTPAGGEPHDYEPTPKDIIIIKNADVFIMNGAGLEPWADKLISELDKKKTTVIDLSKKVELLGNFDPHIWLDPVLAQSETAQLRDTFILLDPKNTDTYKQNAERYLDTLASLDISFQEGLATCNQRQIITSHNAFAYLGARYNFTIQSIVGLSPVEEPSPKHMAELTNLIQSQKIKYIFTETLASLKFSQTLAKEAQVQTLDLNPIEGLTKAEIQQGKNYESLMKENLQNLRLAMECK